MFTIGPAFFGTSQASSNDAYFASTVLLLSFEDAVGSESVFDASPAHRQVIRLGGGGISTAQKKFGASSVSCPGTTGGWQAADSAAWAFGTSMFTVETWIYFTVAPGTATLAFLGQWSGATDVAWRFGMVNGSLSFNFSTTGTGTTGSASGAWTPALNTWYHIAADRDAANVLRVYANGAVVGSTSASVAFRDSSVPLAIGGAQSTGFPSHAGYMDEVRITKGTARYAGAFTPPVAAFPNS